MLTIDLESVFQAEREFEQGIDKLGRRMHSAVQAAVTEGAAEAIRTHGYQDQTGLLTSRIRGFVEVSAPGGATGIIGAFTDYALFVDQDTKRHDIPGNPYLIFKGRDGNWVRTRLVDHPGTKGDHFMTRAFLKAERVIIREVEIGVAELQRHIDS